MESEVFNPANDDVEALSALSIDDFFSTMNSHSDDNTDYFHEQSRVVSHIPNLSTGSQLHVTYPLSPSSINLSEKQRSEMSLPSSTLYSEHVDERTFHIVDPVTGRARRPYLHEFIRLLLEKDEYSHIIQYIDRKQGIFKIHKPKDIGELWKRAKARNSDSEMSYGKLAKAFRYYYSSGIMRPAQGRFTFRFGPKSGFGSTWWPAS